MRSRAVTLAVALALLGPPLRARAAPPSVSERAAAEAHFRQGQADFRDHRFAEARDHFRASYAIAPFPALLFDIALCEEELHAWRAAAEAYRLYLNVAPAAERPRLEHRLAELEALAGEPEREPPAAATTSELLATPPQHEPPRPRWYRRWYVWTPIALAAAAGFSVGLVLGLRGPQQEPLTFGPLDFTR